MNFPIALKYQTGATPISFEQARLFLTEAEIRAGEKRGKMKTGMWQIPVSYQAVAISHNFDNSDLKIFGERTLTNVEQLGYEIEGRVSAEGKRYRGFSSSMLFELPNGKLVKVAIIHVCLNQPK